MDISATAANGVIQADASFQKAADGLSSAATSVDTVSLSDAAISLTQTHLAFSLSIETLKIADDLEKAAIGIVT